MTDFAIRATGISKRYRIEGRRQKRFLRDRLREGLAQSAKALQSFVTRSQRDPEKEIIWALKDVEFQIPRGSSYGLIGANGAGKTTLLKVLSRITAPTEGQVRLRGRVGSLLEVGTGFHAELTGRENVYLNGAVLGMKKKEIDRKFDEIVDFSGVEDFIETPVKRYSSGMRMRLAFSVAAHLEPEILLVDEVLAVGDFSFQQKSLDKMESVIKSGRTILFVSHNLGAVKALCPESIYLDHGQVQYIGKTDDAIDMYLEGNDVRGATDYEIDPSKRAQIFSLFTCSEDGSPQLTFGHDEPVNVRLKLMISQKTFRPHMTMKLHNADMQTLLETNDFDRTGTFLVPDDPGQYEFVARFPANLLVPGNYFLSAELSRQTHRGTNRSMHRLEHGAQFEIVDNGSMRSRFNIPWKGWVQADVNWQQVS